MITHALISGPSSAACAMSGTGNSNPSTKAPPAAAVLARNERRSICPVAVMATSILSSAGRSVDSGTDALVGAAAADIGDCVINVGIGRFWPILQQRHNGHNHSALAVSALRDIVIDPRLLDGVERAVLG